MIMLKRNTSKDLDTTIGRMGRVDFVIPWVYMKDLELMKEILTKAKNGIDMNLLAF